jgi:acetyl-CoA carboxylase biotin carboxyl carrier protein
MDIHKVKEYIELLKEYDLGELEIKTGDKSLRIAQNKPVAFEHPQIAMAGSVKPTAASGVKEAMAAAEAQKEEVSGHALKSPMVGTVYLAPSPGAKPFVEIGQRIKVGDPLCIIEAMKMFNKVESDAAGVVSACLIENGQPVEYDQTLFVIEAE